MSQYERRFSIRDDDAGKPEEIVVDYETHGHSTCLEVHLPDGRLILIGHGCASDGYEIGVYTSAEDFHEDEHGAWVVYVDADNDIAPGPAAKGGS
jgi:hypothetical protein